MLIRNKFGEDSCQFAHSKVIIFFIVHQSTDEDLLLEFSVYGSLFNEIVFNGVNCRPLSSNYCPFASLLPELTHGVGFLSGIACGVAEDDDRLALNFALV